MSQPSREPGAASGPAAGLWGFWPGGARALTTRAAPRQFASPPIVAQQNQPVLWDDDIRRSPACRSKRTFRRIRLNYLWAFGYNLCAVPIAAGALYPPLHFQVGGTRAGEFLCVGGVGGGGFHPAAPLPLLHGCCLADPVSTLSLLQREHAPGFKCCTAAQCRHLADARGPSCCAAATLGGRGGHGPQQRHCRLLFAGAEALPTAGACAAAPGDRVCQCVSGAAGTRACCH